MERYENNSITPEVHRNLTLKGYSRRTIETYVSVVVQLARFYKRSPDQISNEEVPYLLHLHTNTPYSASTINVTINGLRCFYREVLGRYGLLSNRGRQTPPIRSPRPGASELAEPKEGGADRQSERLICPHCGERALVWVGLVLGSAEPLADQSRPP